MSLADAAANGHLQTHKTGADEIRSLRDLIERDMSDEAVGVLIVAMRGGTEAARLFRESERRIWRR